MAVIEDQSGIISLEGIMGGLHSGCEETTQNVFLEAAFFDPIRTAITGRQLGILSDARFRFERGVDPLSTLPGLHAATQMILQLCGGEASEVVVAGHPPATSKPIMFNLERLQSLGGLKVSHARATEILTVLGFTVDDKTVTPPSWRFDVEQEADLVEEILRVEGYDKISSLPYGERPEGKPLAPLQTRRFVARDKLAGRGLLEVVTWSFMSQEDTALFGGVPENLVLMNPISQDLNAMRPSLLPNLLKAVLANQNRGVDAVGLFEIGPQYADATPQGQHMMATGIRAGTFQPENWSEKKRLVDVYDAKADVFSVLGSSVQVEPAAPSWYHHPAFWHL